MWFRRDKGFSIDELIKMEDALRNSELYSMDLDAADPGLSEKLNLKVEYVDDMCEDNEAELSPAEDDQYFGLIRVRKALKAHQFAYIHEIIHYIFDVGYGERVSKTFIRKKKGKTTTRQEQQINYIAAAYIMPYDKILEHLQEYDNSHPKMDEIKFIRTLQEQYEQDEAAVIRRIRESRRLGKIGYIPTVHALAEPNI